MKKSKHTISLLIALAMILSCAPMSFAQEAPKADGTEYLEYHHQVNFDDLDVFVINGGSLDVAVNGDVRSNRTFKVESEIDALMAAISENSEMEDDIISLLNSNEQLAAISFTVAPLLFVDDHYERVLAAAASTYASSDSSGKGKFTMFTSVSRAYSANSNGTYDYTTNTYGYWENSILGGENYPDGSGNDYVLQSTPNTWTRKSHSMTAKYSGDPKTGVENDDFWASDGGTNYLKYVVKDDPFEFAHARQMTNFGLSCVSAGNSSTSYRMINSYYVHTWRELTISVSLSVNSSKEVALNIAPSHVDKNWQLYNYITFDF